MAGEKKNKNKRFLRVKYSVAQNLDSEIRAEGVNKLLLQIVTRIVRDESRNLDTSIYTRSGSGREPATPRRKSQDVRQIQGLEGGGKV